MEIFAILTSNMGLNSGKDFSGAIYSSIDSAQKDVEGSGEISVIKFIVISELEEQGKVFTASTYNRPYDSFEYEGVYGNFDSAKNAAGKHGMVLNREIIGN